jgi:transcriptional regulator with XRE-family HTH domain
VHPLKAFRKRNGLTQAKLAEAVGCRTAMLNQIENCKRDPSARLLRQIKEVTGITADSILSQAKAGD